MTDDTKDQALFAGRSLQGGNVQYTQERQRSLVGDTSLVLDVNKARVVEESTA